MFKHSILSFLHWKLLELEVFEWWPLIKHWINVWAFIAIIITMSQFVNLASFFSDRHSSHFSYQISSLLHCISPSKDVIILINHSYFPFFLYLFIISNIQCIFFLFLQNQKKNEKKANTSMFTSRCAHFNCFSIRNHFFCCRSIGFFSSTTDTNILLLT